MADIALTEIRHGKDDGTVQVFAVGETVKGLSDDDLKALRLAGVVSSTASTEGMSDEEKAAKVAQLEAELLELRRVDAVVSPTPGVAAERMMVETNVAAGLAKPSAAPVKEVAENGKTETVK